MIKKWKLCRACYMCLWPKLRFFGIELLKIHLIGRNCCFSKIAQRAKSLHPIIHIRVQWFFDFQNKTHTVVRNYLRSPNSKCDPLKLRFSICANPLKVLPFLSYILSIWISRWQWRQRRNRDKSAGSARTFAPSRLGHPVESEKWRGRPHTAL